MECIGVPMDNHWCANG